MQTELFKDDCGKGTKMKKKGDRRTMKVEKIKERLYFNGTMDEYSELMKH